MSSTDFREQVEEELLDFCLPSGTSEATRQIMATNPEFIKTWNAIVKLHEAEVERVINDEGELTFSNTYPVFHSLDEYMEHVIAVRRRLREEQRAAITPKGGDK